MINVLYSFERGSELEYKFLEVSRCSRAKQRQRIVQKSVLHVQSSFLLIRDLLLFFTVLRRCLRRLALHYFIFCLNEL